MSCSWWMRLVQNRLDGGRLFSSAAARAHLASCEECRAGLTSCDLLEKALTRMPRPVPSAGLEARIVNAVLADQRARRPREYSSSRLTLALAATLLFCLSVFLLRDLPPRSSTPGTPLPLARSLTPAPGPGAPSGPAREGLAQGDLWKEAETVLTSLTSRAADETVEQGRLLIPVVSPPAVRMQLPAAMASTPTLPLVQAGQAVSVGLEPMTSSAMRAVDLFLRDYSPAGLADSSGL